MAEHMISHYIDVFAGDAHRGNSHGEQVGVATLTMFRLQNQILREDQPPTLRPRKYRPLNSAYFFAEWLPLLVAGNGQQ